MTTFVYIHGFNSGFTRDNPKIAQLETIGKVHPITWNTFAHPIAAREELVSKLPADLTDVVLVGTSLGGFYAAWLGSILSLPSVLINPCTDPYVFLQKHIGVRYTNYVTGVTDILSADAVFAYKFIMMWHFKFRFNPIILLDLADEVLPSRRTAENYEGIFETHVFEGGSHKFDHMEEALPIIKKYANLCAAANFGD